MARTPVGRSGKVLCHRSGERWTVELRLEESGGTQGRRYRVVLGRTFTTEIAASQAGEQVVAEWQGNRIAVRDLMLESSRQPTAGFVRPTSGCSLRRCPRPAPPGSTPSPRGKGSAGSTGPTWHGFAITSGGRSHPSQRGFRSVGSAWTANRTRSLPHIHVAPTVQPPGDGPAPAARSQAAGAATCALGPARLRSAPKEDRLLDNEPLRFVLDVPLTSRR